MENKNNGRGIFYGVIGVATLVVAIIGATFAFFTASVNTDNNAINVGATQVDLVISNQISNFKSNLIPVDTKLADGTNNEAFYSYPGLTKGEDVKGAGTCIDDVGNSICSVYQVTVQNPTGSPTQTIEGSLMPTANSGFTNLKYAVFSGTVAQVTAATTTKQFNVNDTVMTQATEEGTGRLLYVGDVGTINTPQNWGSKSAVQLAAGHDATFTIVLWLEETGSAQDEEQGDVFAAAVTFQSSAGSKVTGVIGTA